MKKRTLIGGVLASTTLGVGVSLIAQFSNKMLYRERLQEESEKCFEEIGAQKIRIENHKQMELQGYLIERKNATHTVICLHPFMKSSSSLKETVEHFKEVYPNVNFLLYDAHAHGLSDGYIRGFGYYDVPDLMYFNTYILQKYGENHKIIMYGKGQGANTILNASGLNKLRNVSLIISEGAYTTVEEYLSHLCQEETKVSYKLASKIIRKTIKNEIHRDVRKMNTVEFVQKNHIPTAFIHSKKDKDVPFEMVFPLYNKNESQKLLFPIITEELYQMEKDDYLKLFLDFIDENK